MSGHLDFRLMSVGLSGNYLPTLSEGLIEYFSSRIVVGNSPERQSYQDKNKHSINYSAELVDNDYVCRIVLQSWVNWRDRKIHGYGEFRVIVVAEVNKSDNLDEREMQGHICIFPRYYTDKNHTSSTDIQLSASKQFMNIIGEMGVIEKEAQTNNPDTVELHVSRLNDKWEELHQRMKGGLPLGDSLGLENVFLIRFKISHSGLTFLKYIPSPVNEAIKTRSPQQQYLITRQAFYYLKYSLHKHKHHHYEADALTTTIKFDKNNKQNTGLKLLDQLKKELIRIKRIQNFGVTLENQNNEALGIIAYARALLVTIHSAGFLPQGIEEREQEYLKSIEQSFHAQNNSQQLKNKRSEYAEHSSRQIITFWLAYVSLTMLIVVNLYVPRPSTIEHSNSHESWGLVTNLQSYSSNEFLVVAISVYFLLAILRRIYEISKSRQNYPWLLSLIKESSKKIWNIIFICLILGSCLLYFNFTSSNLIDILLSLFQKLDS